MKEIERFERLKEMGYTYDAVSGKITSHKGKIITGKSRGYIMLCFTIKSKVYTINAHRFAYWFYYGELPNVIDHINRVKDDNRICNLRSVSKQQNQFNREGKGYTYNKDIKKYQAYITLNNKLKHLGCYEKETQARQAYLDAKKIYHII